MRDTRRFLSLLLVMGLLISSCKNARMQPEKEELAIRHEIDQLEEARNREIENMLNKLEQESCDYFGKYKDLYQGLLRSNDPKSLINFLLEGFKGVGQKLVDYEVLKEEINRCEAAKSTGNYETNILSRKKTSFINFSEAKGLLDCINKIQTTITPLSIKIQEKKQELDKIVKPKKQPYN